MPKPKPDCIYLETSVLLTLPTSLDSAKFENLSEQAHNLDIPVYTVKLCVDEYIQERRERLPEKMRKLEKAIEQLRFFVREMTAAPDMQAISADLEPLFLEALESNQVKVIATATTPQAQLLDMAVKHIRPFEQGDKGFKDTIILHSILGHAKGVGAKSILLLAGDEVFLHADVFKGAAEYGIRLDTRRSIDEGIAFLEGILDDEVRAFYEMRSDDLRHFLLNQRDAITPQIGSRSEIEPWAFGFTRVVEVKKVELIDVVNPLAGFLPSGETHGRVRISFLAKLRASVVGEPSVSPPASPKVKLEEGAVAEEMPTLGALAPNVSFTVTPNVVYGIGTGNLATYWLPPTELIEKPIEHTVGVEASANFDEATGKYSDLKIENVFQPSKIIAELLQKYKKE